MISESKKEELEKKYAEGTNDSLFTYLRRNYPVTTHRVEGIEKPFLQIYVDDRLKLINSKKYITQILFNDIQDNERFTNLEISVIRRTIKKYLDYVMVE